MKLFTIDGDYKIVWEPQTILLAPFKALFDRDKSKTKLKATKELAFVWFYTDIKSDFQIHTDPAIRTRVIAEDVGIKVNLEKDKVLVEAIEYYEKMSTSVTSIILKDSMFVATKLSGQMKEAVKDGADLDIKEITSLLDGVKKMPEVIKALQAAEKAVLKEIAEAQGKTGSKEHALFEDGL